MRTEQSRNMLHPQNVRRGTDRLRPRHCRCGYIANAFTLVEIIIVVVIIAIAALMAIPMIGSTASVQLHSAANMIAADLEYAKSLAISRGQTFKVVFDATNETYRLTDQDGNVIEHPLKKTSYIIDFRTEGRLDSVNILSADFDSGSQSCSQVWFDSLGSPYSAGGALNSGRVRLVGGTHSATVSVEPVTGFIDVSE